MRCLSSGVWGHGFAERYFDGFPGALVLRRYRCPHCGCVHTLRPQGYLPRHQAPASEIVHEVCHRVCTGRWDRGSPRSRERRRHWLRSLKRNIALFLGASWGPDLLEGFFQLLHAGKIPFQRPG